MRFSIPPPPPPPGPSVFVSISHNLDPTEPGSGPRPLSPPFPQKKYIYSEPPPKKTHQFQEQTGSVIRPVVVETVVVFLAAHKGDGETPPPLCIGSQKAKMFTDRLMKGRPC